MAYAPVICFYALFVIYSIFIHILYIQCLMVCLCIYAILFVSLRSLCQLCNCTCHICFTDICRLWAAFSFLSSYPVLTILFFISQKTSNWNWNVSLYVSCFVVAWLVSYSVCCIATSRGGFLYSECMKWKRY